MRRVLAWLALAPLTVMLACATSEERETRLGSYCADDGRPWVRLQRVPADAGAYRRLAARQAGRTWRSRHRRSELWYALPTGETMLCHVDPKLRDPCLSRWWWFSQTPEGPKLDHAEESICFN